MEDDEIVTCISIHVTREEELENALADLIDLYDEGLLIAAPGDEDDVDGKIDRITAVLYSEEDGD